MSAYDLFSLQLRERETATQELERRRAVLERLAHQQTSIPNAPAAAAVPASPVRHGGLRRLLPGRA